MKLFLASEAKNPESVKELAKFVGGFEGKTIAYVPTAGNAQGWGSWKEGGSWNLLQTLGAEITLVQLEDYWDGRDPAEDIRGKDIVWFGGGSCGYLMYWIRVTRLDKKLKGILEAGTIYVGSSAGSMITAKNLDITEWYIDENEPGASVIPGLGLVDFDIYPHFQDGLEDQIKKLYRGRKLYLLKDGEEIIVDGEKATEIGVKRVIT